MNRRLLTITLAVLATVLCASAQPATQPSGPDALDETLALVGLRRADLGWEPKAWWPRYPDVPYKLRCFDALFARPLDSIAFSRALGETAWQQLDPAQLDQRDSRNAGNLFKAVQRLGIDAKFGGFRGYTANVVAPETPLDEALLQLIAAAGRPTHIHTFGMDLPYPKPRADLAEQVQRLPAGVSPILGQLILNIVEAHRWTDRAFRNVDGNDRITVATRYNVGDETIDAYDYCPAIDDLARTLDEASLWYAAQQCTQALDDARVKLAALNLGDVPDFSFDYETPWGWVRVRGGGNDAIHANNELLIVDLAGNDQYFGPVAAADATRTIGLLLDLAGDDLYRSHVPAQGAGLCGVGILLDAAGSDSYEATRYAQGVGQFGLGLCADLAGNDRYFTKFSGQGAGYFGVGLLFDTAGDDTYQIYGDGQGLGGPQDVGVLADRTGNDRYTAVREHSVTGRPSYHSPDDDVCVSNAQGFGMGRRGDGSDGHSWAGGLGAILDGDGDDIYSAGNWSMGTGYWFGIGVLHDRAGNDEYHGVVYSQGSGAHFCIGVHIDEAGNDQHLAEVNSHSALAWAHDFTIALLLDLAGDDRYSVNRGGLGYSINRSVAMLIDAGGNDAYNTREIERPGFAENSDHFRARDGVGTYFADTTSLGLFLDIGGADSYWGALANDTHWLDPPDAPNWTDRNFAVGVDRPDGRLDLTPAPVRPPSGPPPSRR
jgi:hypothetical protein